MDDFPQSVFRGLELGALNALTLEQLLATLDEVLAGVRLLLAQPDPGFGDATTSLLATLAGCLDVMLAMVRAGPAAPPAAADARRRELADLKDRIGALLPRVRREHPAQAALFDGLAVTLAPLGVELAAPDAGDA